MATSKKKLFYIGMGTSGAATEAAMELGLDPDIYDTDILSQVGLTDVAPASTVGIVGVTVKQAANSNRASLLKLTCYQGATYDTATETRNIEILCEMSKMDTAAAGLIDKTVTLGIGATAKSWKIGKVR
ncbi:hypothetical protein [Pseudanabaena sp. BC1403]|uniref:hypothetical protein n=1 Tax=Pseudanabaena sp. BC1403 TaxID=2043171 RepID=UPI000CD8A29C|nr:hypothetical protein [Pseudanabaena sp. BC1403]